MKNWNQLLIRHGFNLEEVQHNVFSCFRETEENVSFLIESLEKLSVSYTCEKEQLSITSPEMDEENWIHAVDFKYRGRGEGLWFRPGIDQPKVRELDTYIAGLVRQLNRLGLTTNGCCDGHDKRNSMVSFINTEMKDKASEVLLAAGIPKLRSRNREISMNISRYQLLDSTEKLASIRTEWLEEGIPFIRRQFFLQQLEEVLSIPGESGNENQVRQYIMQQLKHYVDFMAVDRSGNILAQKKRGNGPVILLNAHMDTYDRIETGRKLIKDGNIWCSDKGILGADDRAGIAAILEIAQRLNTTGFNGTVKFIFTVEEEIGLIGARGIDEYFLWDVEAAIVIDRRGTGDIVTSCGGYIPFCHVNYGALFEKAAERIGLQG
ncbi:M20/M25/M40 family metallo-hydrolase [Neobacillus sp. NPDC093182]|uniref:M20/M25/M40 family metallo-hydrolase n=1 Tax=Neobacillus sp. NPDC093182 TaxID=3364297 RepID=UPI003811C443